VNDHFKIKFSERSSSNSQSIYENEREAEKMEEEEEDDEKLIESLNKDGDEEHLLFVQICFLLECRLIHIQNFKWNLAYKCLERVLKLSCIKLELTGVYGKRTKFQQKDVAQLLLKVSQLDVNNDVERIKCLFNKFLLTNNEMNGDLIPKNHFINDDTLLEKMKPTNPDDFISQEKSIHLSQLEHLIIFNSLCDFHKNNPKHNLTFEEMSPYIEFLLVKPKNWCVQVCTLFMRTKLEESNSRRIERSLLQLENLVDFFKRPDGEPELKDRFQFFFSLEYPSFWRVQNELAKFYTKLGLINSSLEIYLGLENWKEVIDCYQCLEKNEKAQEIIKQQLEIKETPELYCSLGDVTRDCQYYFKAIELSKNRSAKAYRMLAKHSFLANNYKEAITYFEKTLAINPMQYNAWFMLGSAAFRSDQWATAIKAFRTCTNLEPDNHETWNNLAASYIKLNQKNKAHTVFQEALKFEYENWKIWENYLWTSIDCAYFSDVIRAYHRLLDLKDKYVDIGVLKALSLSVQKDMNDANGVSIYNNKQKILELFGRISSMIVNNWQIYWYYAEVTLHFSTHTFDSKTNEIVVNDLSEESGHKVFALLQKSFRNLYNQPNWEMTLESCEEVLITAEEILLSIHSFFVIVVFFFINKSCLFYHLKRVFEVW
jgi:tetratricopeptide (TPR) repeat protein